MTTTWKGWVLRRGSWVKVAEAADLAEAHRLLLQACQGQRVRPGDRFLTGGRNPGELLDRGMACEGGRPP